MAILTNESIGFRLLFGEKNEMRERVWHLKKFHLVICVCDCVLLSLTWPGFVHSPSRSLTSYSFFRLPTCLRRFDCNQIERNFDTAEMPKAYQFSIIEYLCKISIAIAYKMGIGIGEHV